MLMQEGASTNPAVLGSKLFKGFSDPTRLALLLALLDGERRVTDLVNDVGTSQPNVSAHMACLKDCGLVVDRPQGRQTFYRLATDAVRDVLISAERVLEDIGHAVALCPNYGQTAN